MTCFICCALLPSGDRCLNPSFKNGLCKEHFALGASCVFVHVENTDEDDVKMKCKGVCKNGSPCSQAATIAGFCLQHLKQLQVKGEKNE